MRKRMCAVLPLVAIVGWIISAPEAAATTPASESGSLSSAEDSVVPVRATRSPGAPGTPKAARPSPQSPLAMVAAVVQVRVEGVWEGYDERTGPRQFYQLTRLRNHAGEAPEKFTISQLGGTLPNDRRLVWSNFVNLKAGSRYLLVLAEAPNIETSVVDGLAFEVRTVGSIDIAVSADGQAVRDVQGGVVTYGGAVVGEGGQGVVAGVAPIPSVEELSEHIRSQASALGAPIGASLRFSVPEGIRWNHSDVVRSQ